MKNVFCLLFLIHLNAILPAQITFQKTFGGSSTDYGSSIQQTTDGGYIIAGATSSFGSGGIDVYLIKTNANGDTLWTKTYGELGASDETGLFVQQTTDGGYIIAGSSFVSFPAAYIIKTDANGNVIWAKMFSSSLGAVGIGKCIKQTVDGGYIITGCTSENFSSPDGYEVFLLKIDANGILLWKKTLLDGHSTGFSLNQTADGGYIITGNTWDHGVGGQDVFLIKTDGNGIVLWTKTYGGTNNDVGNCVQQTRDGGYIVTGTTESFGGSGKDVYLIKTDTSGNILWTKTYGGANADYGYFVQQTTDRGYIISGSTKSSGAGNSDAYLIKTDTLGATIWSKTYGGADDDYAYSVQQTIDSSYIIVGSTGGIANSDVYLIKTDKNGNSGCNEGNSTTTSYHAVTSIVTAPSYIPSSQNGMQGNAAPIIGSGGTTAILCFATDINELTTDIMFNAYPNPAQSNITLEFDVTETKNISIEIKNVLEQTVKTINNRAFSNGKNKIEIDVSEFAKGMYFVQLQNGNKILSKKFVKQ